MVQNYTIMDEVRDYFLKRTTNSIEIIGLQLFYIS
jgi:hypothetical protein